MQVVVAICITTCCLSAAGNILQVRAAKESYAKIELGMTMVQVETILGNGYRTAGNLRGFNAWWPVGEPEFENTIICIEFDANELVVSRRWICIRSLKRPPRRTTR